MSQTEYLIARTRRDFLGQIHVRLEDIPEWEEIHGICFACKHVGYLSRPYLSVKLGLDRRLRPAEYRLRCTKCGNRFYNFIVFAKRLR